MVRWYRIYEISWLKENWHGFGTYLEKFTVYWYNPKNTIHANKSFVEIRKKKLRRLSVSWKIAVERAPPIWPVYWILWGLGIWGLQAYVQTLPNDIMIWHAPASPKYPNPTKTINQVWGGALSTAIFLETDSS